MNQDSELERKIMRLSVIKEMKATLSREENMLSEPLLTDMSLVRNIYDLFISYHKGRKVPMQRKMFIFVILYLYSPCALVGSKMRRGLREKIATILQCTNSNVSHDYKNVSFFFTTYKGFRKEALDVIDRLRQDLHLNKD